MQVDPHRLLYLSIPFKYTLAIVFAAAWLAFSVWLSLRWIEDLADYVPLAVALFVIAGIAYLPGFMNSFLMTSLMLDRRPKRRAPPRYPPVTILIACYNEEASIADTLRSVAAQDYPGELEVLVVDDGSHDRSVEVAEAAIAGIASERYRFRVERMQRNGGKARALNHALAVSAHELVITLDGDSWVYRNAIRNLVERLYCDPDGTVAVAGAILVRNSRKNWITRVQEWDYFHGIAAVKRMQSMYHGTLVAQGAFSLYTRTALNEVGGWPECVGEDIVLSWSLLERGYRLGYAEDACVFTNVPDTLKQFANQRRRWSRGLIEAFQRHGRLLLKPRMTTKFIWWNLFFLPLDLVYTLVFIPGLIAALFGFYLIVGIMTLLVLPIAMLWNWIIFGIQSTMFARNGLKVRRNVGGFLLFVFAYSLILQPVCVWGYVSELLKLRKSWGTK